MLRGPGGDAGDEGRVQQGTRPLTSAGEGRPTWGWAGPLVGGAHAAFPWGELRAAALRSGGGPRMSCRLQLGTYGRNAELFSRAPSGAGRSPRRTAATSRA